MIFKRMKVAAIFPSEVKQDIEIDLSTEQALGIAYVAQAARNAGHDTKLYYGHPSLEELARFDVLAFGSLTKDIPATIGISTKVKQINPRIISIIGGSHISGDPEFVLNDCMDYGIIGEGEATFVELLDALENNKDTSVVKGVVYSMGNKLSTVRPRERLDSTGLRPIRVDDFYEVYDPSIYYPAPSVRRYIPLIAERGCTMGCEFCDTELIWGKQVKYRKSTDIIAELGELYQGPNDIFMFDDNNFFFDKNAVKELLVLLTPKNYNLASCGDIRKVDEQMLKLLKHAGWISILWGIESVNPHVLDKEKEGLDPKKVYDTLQCSEQMGIFNHGMCLMGFEYETEDDILRYGRELADYPIHQFRLSIATPFKGTDFYNRLKKTGHTFDTSDISKWDTGHLVYDHPTISPERMEELQREIVVNFYSNVWRNRMHAMSTNFPRLNNSIGEFVAYVDSKIK